MQLSPRGQLVQQVGKEFEDLTGIRLGLEVVPELARKHGLQVTMGAWLSSKLDKNEAEVNSLIALANRYPDTITRVIAGNEVLLRRDLPVEELARQIDRVKAAVRQPVTYADVWEFWAQFPELARHVDVVTIHILPYWEDEPLGVDRGPNRLWRDGGLQYAPPFR